MNNPHVNRGNILLVANWESDIGYAWWLMENFWVTIAGHFEHRGSSSYLIYPKITQIPDAIESSCIKVLEHNFRDRSPSSLDKLHQIIRRNAIQYLYLSDAKSYSLVYPLLKLWGIKTIVVHEHFPGDRTIATSWRKLLKSGIQRIPFYTADHFIAVSDFVYRRFIQVACIPASKCSTAPNGIMPISLSHIDREYAKNNFNIPDNRLIVVSTGRADNYKGIDFIIKCCAEFVHHRSIYDLHFLFCGDGPDLEYFRELVSTYQVEEYFTLAGKRSDIRDILPSCDIGFHASKGEVGYSLSIIEYMSAGLATIVPDLPSTSEATRHEDNGLLYSHGDVSSACDAIQLCRSSEFRGQLSRNARSTAGEEFNLEHTNTQLINILDRLFT